MSYPPSPLRMESYATRFYILHRVIDDRGNVVAQGIDTAANALLFAAAPDLLQAAQIALDEIGLLHPDEHGFIPSTRFLAESIAKATGK